MQKYLLEKQELPLKTNTEQSEKTYLPPEKIRLLCQTQPIYLVSYIIAQCQLKIKEFILRDNSERGSYTCLHSGMLAVKIVP